MLEVSTIGGAAEETKVSLRGRARGNLKGNQQLHSGPKESSHYSHRVDMFHNILSSIVAKLTCEFLCLKLFMSLRVHNNFLWLTGIQSLTLKDKVFLDEVITRSICCLLYTSRCV